MSAESRQFVDGDRVRVSDRCFDRNLRGAVGTVCAKLPASVNRANDRIAWIEFDPWITGASEHPIEAAEVDVADLDPAQLPCAE